MSIVIKCFIELKSCGGLNAIGLSSANNIQVNEPLHLNNVSLFGVKIISGVITPINAASSSKTNATKGFRVELRLEGNMSESCRVKFIEELESYLTLLLTRDEQNQHHGINYAEVNWRDYDTYVVEAGTENVFVDTVRMRDSCSMVTTRTFVLKDEQWNLDTEYKDIFRNYYDGIKANYIKSKYFHWFLILEAIEYSELYKREHSERLFTASEMNMVEELANKFPSGSVKRSAILNLKTRTSKSRKDKLYETLCKIGVRDYLGSIETHEMNLDTVSRIIDFRNQLFHKSTNFDEALLWEHLFPIVRAVVELSVENSKLLE